MSNPVVVPSPSCHPFEAWTRITQRLVTVGLKAVGDRYPAGGAVTAGRYGRCVITVHAPPSHTAAVCSDSPRQSRRRYCVDATQCVGAQVVRINLTLSVLD